MGMRRSGGSGDPSKIKIYVGFLLPQVQESNSIYVRIKKEGTSVHAEAVSRTHFICPNYSRDGTFRTNNASNFVGDSHGWIHVPVDTFLIGLQRENNAEVVERYREDGLELTAQLATLRQSVNDLAARASPNLDPFEKEA